MLLKFYNFLQSKISQSESRLASKVDKRASDLSNFSLFSFQIIFINQTLVLQSILADIIKYLIVLFYPHSDSFMVLFHQKEQLSCGVSYHEYKTIQKKVRTFSVAGTASIVAVTVVTSLLTNLIFGGALFGHAQVYGWIQNSWSDNASTTATANHDSNQTGWGKFFSKDGNVVASSSLSFENRATTSNITFNNVSDYIQQNASSTSFATGSVQLGFSASTTLLMHFEGVDGSTAFIDSSSYNHSFTPSGAAQIKTAQKAVGSSSLYLANAASDTINVNSPGNDFYFPGDFTIDTWYKYVSGGGSSLFVISDGSTYLALNCDGSTYRLYMNDSSGSYVAGSVSTNWQHIALVRSGSSVRLYINGTDVGGMTNSNALGYINPGMARIGGGMATAGYIDGLRITKGVARWTTNFATSSIAYTNRPYVTLPYYITTATTSQLNTSSWFGIKNVAFTQTTPSASTTLKYLVSFNNRQTWKYWSGSAWINSSLANLEIDGMSKVTIENITNAQWGSVNGFSAGTLDFAVSLKTTDESITPLLDNIQVNSQPYVADKNLTTNVAFSTSTGFILQNASSTSFASSTAQLSTATKASTTLLMHFDGANNSTIMADATGLNNWTAGGNAKISNVQSKFGGSSVYFDGAGDYLLTPTNNNLQFGTGDFTVEAWVFPTATPVGAGIIGQMSSGNNASWIMLLNSDLSIQACLTSNCFGVASVNKVNLNQWNHVAITRSGTTVYAFVNGTSTSATSNADTGSLGYNYTIGADNEGDQAMFTGYMDELRVTKGLSRWTSNFTPSASPYIFTTSPIYLTVATTTYFTTATSTQKNTSTWSNITGLSLAQSTPASTSLKYLVSFDNRSTWKYWTGSLWATSTLANLETNGMSSTTLSGLNSTQWSGTNGFVVSATGTLDFAISLKTNDQSVTPSLSAINVTYDTPTPALISTSYNTISPVNTVEQLMWTESLATGTDIFFQIRTSADGSSWSDWAGPDGSSTLYFTDPNGGEPVGASSSDGVDDQWIQYKAYLSSSDTAYTPTLSEVNFKYKVNARPEWNPDYPTNGAGGYTALQDPGGLILIQYSLRDPDTIAGLVNPGNIIPSYEYSLDNGETYLPITLGLSAGATDPKAMEQVNYTDYQVTWNPVAQLGNGTLVASATIRIAITDGEVGQNTIVKSSNSFNLNTMVPIMGLVPVRVDASVNPAKITLDATDVTELRMKLSLESDLSDVADWSMLNLASTTYTLAANPDTIYYQVKNNAGLGFASGIYSATTPESPKSMIIADISNVKSTPYEYRLFGAWKIVADPTTGNGFSKYEVYRSTDTVNWMQLATITDRMINYFTDSAIAGDTNYYYKVKTIDNNGNISYWSDMINAKANGVYDIGEGGSTGSSAAPIISNVNVAPETVYTTSAIVTWNTDVLSDSQVFYQTASGCDFASATSTGLATIANTAAGIGVHKVVITGLLPNTTYYYRTRSTDLVGTAGNESCTTNASSFTTQSGAIITPNSVQFGNINNNSVDITWTTDVTTDSYVLYSNTVSSGNLVTPTTIGHDFNANQHGVTVSGLESGTTYYFTVKSGSAEDHNGNTGYYTFQTTLNLAPPTISAISSSTSNTSATVNFITAKTATTSVTITDPISLYTGTKINDNLNSTHQFIFDSLASSTTYDLIIVARDANGNYATSTAQLTTAAAPDTTPPTIIFNPGTDIITTATDAVINWTTTEPATTYIEYNQSTSTFAASSTRVGRADLVTDHSIRITGLETGKTYYFNMTSTDSAGNMATEPATPAVYHSFAAVIQTLSISNVSTSTVTDHSAVIIWQTNHQADSYIEYGTSTGNYAFNQLNNTETIEHAAIIAGLLPNTDYYYRVISTDALGQSASSSEYIFKTADQPIDPADYQNKVTEIGNLQAEVADLRTQLATATSTNETLGTQVASLELLVASLESQLAVATSSLEIASSTNASSTAELETQIADLNNQLAALTIELDTASTSLASSTAAISGLLVTISDKQTEIDNLNIALVAAEATSSARLLIILDLQLQIEQLQNDLAAATSSLATASTTNAAAIADLDSQIAALTGEKNALEIEKTNLLAEIEALNILLAAATSTIESASTTSAAAIADLEAQLLAKQGEIDAKQAVIDAKQADIDSLNIQVINLTNALAVATSTIASSSAHISQLEADIADLNAQLSTMVTQSLYDAEVQNVLDLQGQIANLNVLLADATSSLHLSEEAVATLTAARDALQLQLDAAISPATHQAALDEITNLNNTITNLNAIIASSVSTTTYQIQVDLVADLQNQLTLRQAEILSLITELDTASSSLVTANLTIESLQAQISDLYAQLASATTSASISSTTAADLQLQVNDLQSQVSALQLQLASASTTNASSTQLIADLQAQIVTLNSMITSQIDPADYAAKVDKIAELQAELAIATSSGAVSLTQIAGLQNQITQLQQELETAKKSSGGGGVMIIDKTDTVAPVVSEVNVVAVSTSSALISWRTNENSIEIIKYGFSALFGGYYGNDNFITNHLAILEGLTPGVGYKYQISALDHSGNMAQTSILDFVTKDYQPYAEVTTASTTATSSESIVDELTVQLAAQNAIDLLGRLSQVVSLASFESAVFNQYDALKKMASSLPSPFMSGEPGVDITSTTATISWNTDKESNSLVAMAPEILYVDSRGNSAYTQVLGDSHAKTTRHTVKLYDLKPDTTYHYQLQNEAPLGKMSRSKDFTFKTKLSVLEITNSTSGVVSPQKATFRWLTSEVANSQLTAIPYRQNKLAIDEARQIFSKSYTMNHEADMDNFESGVVYQIEMASVNQRGAKINKIIPYFSTTKDDLPPAIVQIQTESALSQSAKTKVQTVISWQTNEPTISQIIFGKGVIVEEKMLTDATPVETAYGRKHTAIITNFEPGAVYSFRVRAVDSGDNATVSSLHTLLTPKQRASIIDLIIGNFESSFGWLAKVGQ